VAAAAGAGHGGVAGRGAVTDASAVTEP